MLPNSSLLDLAGKVAIVTGGSAGIGFGIVRRLAQADAKVVIASRDQAEADEAVTYLTNKGFQVKFVQTDVTDEAQVKNLVEKTLEMYGAIDILVNNAGIFPFKPVMDLDSELFDKVVAVNLRGVFLCTKYVGQQLIKQGMGGKIINITSIDALHPSAVGLAHYDATKHGVWGFTKNVALELAPHKIWVNAVAPGGIMTPGGVSAQGGDTKAVSSSNLENAEPTEMDVPMKRIGMPDDVGKVVLFLASDMSSYMTGEQIVVDGGYLLK